jgi:hypothetical protein
LRVQRFDQIDLFGATPKFDFFLAGECRTDAGLRFEPNELCDVVLLREAGDEFFFVLTNALGEAPQLRRGRGRLICWP